MGYLWIILTVTVLVAEVAPGEAREYCHNHICNNGGTCYYNSNGHTSCKCTHEYTGYHCDTLIDQCASSPCLHGGTCSLHHDAHQNHHCECKTGWMGSNCETVDPCTSKPCQNGGTCSHSIHHSHHHKRQHPNNYHRYDCGCMPGYTGDHCETVINTMSNECASSPCINGASCENTSDGFKCTCPANWSGQQCDKDIDECERFHFCQNGATCVNTPGSFHCACAQGYTGTQCAQESNMCDSQPCMNGAHCNGNSTHYSCQCQSGFVGKDCEKDDVCTHASPCLNSATCISDTSGQVTCSCTPGYFGVHCEKGQPNTCNHICTLQSVVKHQYLHNINASTCLSSLFASNEALPMHCCQTLTSDHWFKGPNVMVQCNSGTMVPYSAVSKFKPDGTVEPDTSGILIDCLPGGAGFSMARQDCSSFPILVHVNGTAFGSIDFNPDHYFVVL